ncbi:ubiquinol-cytochrome c reductase iron-sulfur subunit [Myxococcota bacterium]|nr:ubiquinol-cytochrome c reductase iron-sulfur subunit [Myxococcota bacterium]
MAEDRRTVLKILTGACGGIAAGLVAVPSVRALVAPYGKRTVIGAGSFVPVAKLDVLPADGSPVKVPVVLAAPQDAWTKLPPTEVGAVFLRRDGDAVIAYSTVCPHLGCGVDWAAERGQYSCPCHESWFDAKGAVASGPSPRGLDALEAQVKDGVVEVRFLRFEQGTAEKIPV